MPDLAIVDGELMHLEQATVSVLDLGFLRGMGAFETLRTYDGQPHALDAHLRRLHQAAEALGIGIAIDAAAFREQLRVARERSCYQDLLINMVVTPGRHSGGVFGGGAPTRVVIVRELREPPVEWYGEGVAAVTFHGQRVCPQFKTTAYITGREGLLAAEAAAAHEAIYCDDDGVISEGVTSNVLLRRGDTVLQPDAPSLDGITQRGLRGIVESAGLAWQQARLRRDDLLAADEVWLCSAIRELVPVVRVDGSAIGEGRPGEWAARLREAYRNQALADARRDAEDAGIVA